MRSIDDAIRGDRAAGFVLASNASEATKVLARKALAENDHETLIRLADSLSN